MPAPTPIIKQPTTTPTSSRRDTPTTGPLSRPETFRPSNAGGGKSDYDAFLAYAFFVLDQQARYCQE